MMAVPATIAVARPGRAAGQVNHDVRRVSVAGTVFDSLGLHGIAGARVQLLKAGDGGNVVLTTLTDDRGRYEFAGIVPGKYYIDFYDRALDTLGIEARAQVVDIGPRGLTHDLATPSAASLMTYFCPADTANEKRAVVFGHVRSARSESSVDSGLVSMRWAEPRIDQGRIEIADYSLEVPISRGGLFVFCNVPFVGVVTLIGSGADGSAKLDMSLSAGAARHATLYLSPRQRPATGVIIGRVRDTTGSPVHSANVRATSSNRETVTGTDGVFTLDSVPIGTQTIAVQAIGFAPAERTVPVLLTTSDTLPITLRRAIVLPTVSTNASAQPNLDRFERNRRVSTGGYFIKPPSPAVAAPTPLRNLIEGLPGLRISTAGGATTVLMQRPTTYMNSGSPAVPCTPRFFINGVRSDMTFDEISRAYFPSDIAGIEVYVRENQVPSTYPPLINSPCGLISIWLRGRN
jgi:hypothetical protein